MPDSDESLEHRVPRRDDFQLADIRSILTHLSTSSDRLTRAICGDLLDPHAPPGLMHKVAEIERKVALMEVIMADRPVKLMEHNEMMLKLRKIDEGQEKSGDRFWTVAWDVIRIALAGIFGALVAQSKGNFHP